MGSSVTPPAYTVEPELAGPVPRRVRYTRETWLKRAWLANVTAGLFFYVLWAAGVDVGFYRRVVMEGVTTSATVTEVGASNSRSRTYRAHYSYAVPGHGRLSYASDVPGGRYGVLSAGDTLPVTYLPSTPTEHVIGTVAAGDVVRRRHRWNLALLLVVLAGAVANLAYALRTRGKYRLLESGVAVPAVVTARTDEPAPRVGRIYSVSYRYPSASGEPVTARMAVDEATYDALPEGSAFTLLCDADGRHAVPYFAHFGVEVPGGAGPRLPL